MSLTPDGHQEPEELNPSDPAAPPPEAVVQALKFAVTDVKAALWDLMGQRERLGAKLHELEAALVSETAKLQPPPSKE